MRFPKVVLAIAVAFLAIPSLPYTQQSLVRPVRLRVLRMHSGKDCTSGELSLENKIVGYTLERPWTGNIPLISSIPAGRYKGFVRVTTKDRWRIELIDVPQRTNIQLHIGNFIPDGVGCLLVGSNLSKDLCQLIDSKSAFDKFKLAFAETAARLGQNDLVTPVELVVQDQ